MLIEFRVENHRSLRDEQVLTMEAAPELGEDPRARVVEGYEQALLPAAGIYGGNASGKSNVLDALAFMRSAVLTSQRFWTPEGGVPRSAFAWGPRASEPSLFQISAIVNGRRHEYGFVVDDERVLEEWLHVWDAGDKQTWFERDDETFEFGPALVGDNEVIARLTRPNALFLSAAAQTHHAQLTSLFTWFRQADFVNITRASRTSKATIYSSALLELMSQSQAAFRFDPEEDEGPSESIVDFLRAADIGILDVKVEEQPGRRGQAVKQVFVRHESVVEDAWLPLEEESRGTIALFRMAPQILESLRTGGVLVVDELEASLHPLMARWIIQQFNDPKTNPKLAQLLFSTHDTNLLGTTTGPPLMRRDQIWLTEKDNEGATVLYPLTEFKPQPSENLELGYLQGRYGAVPMLDALLGDDA